MPIFGTRTRAPGLDANLDPRPFDEAGSPRPQTAANDDAVVKPVAATPDADLMTPTERSFADAQGLLRQARDADRAMRLVAGTGLPTAGPVNPINGSTWRYDGMSLADLRQERAQLEARAQTLLYTPGDSDEDAFVRVQDGRASAAPVATAPIPSGPTPGSPPFPSAKPILPPFLPIGRLGSPARPTPRNSGPTIGAKPSDAGRIFDRAIRPLGGAVRAGTAAGALAGEPARPDTEYMPTSPRNADAPVVLDDDPVAWFDRRFRVIDANTPAGMVRFQEAIRNDLTKRMLAALPIEKPAISKSDGDAHTQELTKMYYAECEAAAASLSLDDFERYIDIQGGGLTQDGGKRKENYFPPRSAIFNPAKPTLGSSRSDVAFLVRGGLYLLNTATHYPSGRYIPREIRGYATLAANGNATLEHEGNPYYRVETEIVPKLRDLDLNDSAVKDAVRARLRAWCRKWLEETIPKRLD